MSKIKNRNDMTIYEKLKRKLFPIDLKKYPKFTVFDAEIIIGKKDKNNLKRVKLTGMFLYPTDKKSKVLIFKEITVKKYEHNGLEYFSWGEYPEKERDKRIHYIENRSKIISVKKSDLNMKRKVINRSL